MNLTKGWHPCQGGAGGQAPNRFIDNQVRAVYSVFSIPSQQNIKGINGV